MKSCENCNTNKTLCGENVGNETGYCKNFDQWQPDYQTLAQKNIELTEALIKCFDYADNAPLDRVGMVDAFGDIRGVVRETGVLPDEEL